MCFPLEVFVTGNALVLMPDYMGYGITKNSIHPYLNHELCAINSVDAFPAGYAVFEQLSDKGLKNDLTKGWSPVHPIKMHYSTGDRIVSYHNTLAAKEAFGSKVILTTTSTPMEHMATCAMWMAGIFMAGL